MWYCAHLTYVAHHNGDEHHVREPILRPHGY